MTAAPVFVLGAARSGTTWVQQLLGAHPKVATCPETHLGLEYLAPLAHRWDAQRRAIEECAARLRDGTTLDRRVIGLPTVFSDADFDELLASVITRFCDRVLELKPGSEVVVEKSPSNSRAVRELVRAAPEARFLHVVRDPRDVVASMLRASEGWGRRWAPTSATEAAQRWRRNFLGGRAAAGLGVEYVEVRYEEVWSAPADELRRLLAFCGIAVSTPESQRLVEQVEQYRVDGAAGVPVGGEAKRLIGVVVPEPAGFYGPGQPGRWRSSLDAEAVAAVEEVVGDLLDPLGYEATAP